jgi:peptidoglycan hydrolase-like protein with peptidoglycan-binding domain
MRCIIISTFVAGVVAAAAPVSAAERYAVVIANQNYADAPAAHAAAGDAEAVATALEAQGYEVQRLTDLDRDGMQDAIRDLELQAGRHETMVLFYSGHAVRVDGVNMLAPVDGSNATRTDAVMGGAPLDLLLAAAAGASDRAVAFIDAAQLDGFPPTEFAEPGLAVFEPPEGVLVVSAAAPGEALRRGWWNKTSAFSAAVIEQYLAPGAKAAEVSFGASSPIWVAGSAAPSLTLVAAPPAADASGGASTLNQQLELELWRAAEGTGDVADYRAYLARFPNGVFSGIARNRIAAAGGRVQIQPPTTPAPAPAVDTDKAIEDALNLTLAERREIQRDLTQLGYDTRGIDGKFGPGTRRSIRLLQESLDLAPTGYLTAALVRDLNAAARRDAEAKRVAEERRRAEERAADEALWRDVSRRADMASYSEYLDRYPEGIHASEANAQVERLLDRQRRNAQFRDRADWEAAERENRLSGYREYLAEWPDGAFADLARARVREMEGEETRRSARREYEARERALGLTQRDLLSLEQRLAYIGYHPGGVDGRIDREARAAIREYQSARRLEVTGYFDNPTVSGIVRETNASGDPRAIIAGEAIRGLLGILND